MTLTAEQRSQLASVPGCLARQAEARATQSAVPGVFGLRTLDSSAFFGELFWHESNCDGSDIVDVRMQLCEWGS